MIVVHHAHVIRLAVVVNVATVSQVKIMTQLVHETPAIRIIDDEVVAPALALAAVVAIWSRCSPDRVAEDQATGPSVEIAPFRRIESTIKSAVGDRWGDSVPAA